MWLERNDGKGRARKWNRLHEALVRRELIPTSDDIHRTFFRLGHAASAWMLGRCSLVWLSSYRLHSLRSAHCMFPQIRPIPKITLDDSRREHPIDQPIDQSLTTHFRPQQEPFLLDGKVPYHLTTLHHLLHPTHTTPRTYIRTHTYIHYTTILRLPGSK